MVKNDLRERLSRQVKLRELRVLLAVAEQGSFRKAGRLLHLTQPAVTASIAELEGTLGVRLFERTTRGVTPTVHGASFARRASAIFGELGRAAEDIEIISRGSRQTLRVGVGGGGWGQGILSAALAKLLDSPLDAFVLIREADEDVLLELLKARELDLFFSRLSPLAADPDLSFSLAAWSSLWGIAGAFLAVPITAIMAIVFSEFDGTRPIAVLLSRSGRV